MLAVFTVFLSRDDNDDSKPGGGILYEKVGDVRGLGYKSKILVSLRVLTTKRQYF